MCWRGWLQGVGVIIFDQDDWPQIVIIESALLLFLCTQLFTQKNYVHKKTMYTKKNCVHTKKHMYTKKKKKKMYICLILFFLCTQILGLVIFHCARKPVFGMHWILDLELLLLISRIARKWNRAKTFFVRSHSPPKNPFLLRQEISRE